MRRVRTGSGATAVQVVEKRHGKLVIIEHVGSAHTEVELALLLERAERVLRGEQGVLELSIADQRLAVPLIGQAEPSMLPGTSPGPVGQRAVVGGPRTVGAVSEVLWSTLRSAYAQLGFDALGDEVFEQLVLARLVEPASKLATGRILEELGVRAPHRNPVSACLKRVQAQKYRDTLATQCFEHASTKGDVSLVLYDVTTLYFEAENEDDLRKVGYSKERRVDPQIVVGLLVDRAGFPLEIGCFEGNRAETTTIIPIIKAFQERHDVTDMVIVADAGMLSATNLKELEEANLRFIVGSRPVKAPLDLASHFRWHGDAFTDGQLIDTITPRGRRPSENDVNHKAEPTWDPQLHPNSWRAVWAYSAKRAARDTKTLTLQENKAKAVIAGEKSARTPRFVKTTKGVRTLDEKSLARARRLAGLKGYVANIPATVMPAAEVISSYHDLWRVEASFRMSKTDLRARPLFARRRDAIEAHLTIVFTALAVAREVQSRTGLAIRNVVRQLRPLRSATIAINATSQAFPPAIGPDQQTILDAIHGPKLTH